MSSSPRRVTVGNIETINYHQEKDPFPEKLDTQKEVGLKDKQPTSILKKTDKLAQQYTQQSNQPLTNQDLDPDCSTSDPTYKPDKVSKDKSNDQSSSILNKDDTNQSIDIGIKAIKSNQTVREERYMPYDLRNRLKYDEEFECLLVDLTEELITF